MIAPFLQDLLRAAWVNGYGREFFPNIPYKGCDKR